MRASRLIVLRVTIHEKGTLSYQGTIINMHWSFLSMVICRLPCTNTLDNEGESSEQVTAPDCLCKDEKAMLELS